MTTEANALTKINTARQAIASIATLDDAREAISQLAAFRAYVRAIDESGELQNAAAELKLRAERKAGQMLAGVQWKANQHDPEKPTLADYGISHSQASRWRSEAAIPDTEFEAYLQACRDQTREVTQQGLLRWGKTTEVDATMTQALRCEHCGNRTSSVARTDARKELIERERVCRRCKHLYETVEIPKKEYLRMVAVNQQLQQDMFALQRAKRNNEISVIEQWK